MTRSDARTNTLKAFWALTEALDRDENILAAQDVFLHALSQEEEGLPEGLFNLVIPRVLARQMDFVGQDGSYDVFTLSAQPDEELANSLIDDIIKEAYVEVENIRESTGIEDLDISQMAFIMEKSPPEPAQLSPGDHVKPNAILEEQAGFDLLGVVLENTDIDGSPAALVRWMGDFESTVDCRLLDRVELN